MRARFYNPVIARFTQEDTYRGAGLNLYSYCNNNPVYYDDPSGHQPNCVKDAAQRYMEQGMSAEEAYRRAYAEHANESLKKTNNLTAQERYELEQRRARLIYGEAERVTGMTRDEIRTEAHIGNENNLQVLAIYEQNGQRYMDVNPTARADSYRTGEVIPASVTAPDGSTISLSNYRGQNNTSSAHGEIGAMNQSYTVGEQGGDATLTVLGQPVCPTCQNRNVRTMAVVSNVGTLTVNDYMSNGTYQFSGANNGFFSRNRGGVTWSNGRVSNDNPSTGGN